MSGRADEQIRIFFQNFRKIFPRDLMLLIVFLLVHSSAHLLIRSAHAENITISSDACANATRLVPDADVTFKQGVDINGNKIAPADLPAAQGGAAPLAAPTQFTIPLFFDLQQALHLQSNNFVTPNASIGAITYDNGRLNFNGQSLNDEAQVALAVACKQNGRAEQQTSRGDILHGQP